MHEHGQEQEHDHAHSDLDEHEHAAEHHHEHENQGLLGRISHALTPHSHDYQAAVLDAALATDRGIRAVKMSLVILLVSAAFQVACTIRYSTRCPRSWMRPCTWTHAYAAVAETRTRRHTIRRWRAGEREW